MPLTEEQTSKLINLLKGAVRVPLAAANLSALEIARDVMLTTIHYIAPNISIDDEKLLNGNSLDKVMRSSKRSE